MQKTLNSGRWKFSNDKEFMIRNSLIIWKFSNYYNDNGTVNRKSLQA